MSISGGAFGLTTNLTTNCHKTTTTEEVKNMNEKLFIDLLLQQQTFTKALNEVQIKFRYAQASEALGRLANTQLNLDKNKIKCDFEDMTLQEIKTKLNEEITEFWNELKGGHRKINFEKALNELGDIAACLVGFLVLLMQIKNSMLK
jgi:hypothetical protein